MKELTIEQKAQRYDEAIERARRYYDEYKTRDNILYVEDMEDMFPELIESEDEKMRKQLLNWFKECHWDTIDDGTLKRDDIIAWLEKQGEQKPADKVEPKFKVGDFVVNDYCLGKVIELTDDAYLLDTGQGIPFSCEHNAHLWTIQDAKDGDVLTCYSDIKGQPIEQTGIIKQYVGRHGGCSNSFKAHFGVDWDNNVVIEGYMGSSNIYPATKEQRDTLMKAMADAGYTFDFEKKELKKIEQKAAWSEEDEYYCGIIQYILNDECVGKADKENAINWFKSLKDRYTWKPSEEQLKSLQEVIDAGHYTSYPYTLETLYEQIKKLKKE